MTSLSKSASSFKDALVCTADSRFVSSVWICASVDEEPELEEEEEEDSEERVLRFLCFGWGGSERSDGGIAPFSFWKRKEEDEEEEKEKF